MYKLLDKTEQAYLQSLAQLARIHELQGRTSRAYVYAEMIPQDFRNSFMSPYRHLILGNAEQPYLEAQAVQLSPPASDQSERTPINTPKSSNKHLKSSSRCAPDFKVVKKEKKGRIV